MKFIVKKKIYIYKFFNSNNFRNFFSISITFLNQVSHMNTWEAESQIPQVSPGANLMYPFSPQLTPHEFLMIQ